MNKFDAKIALFVCVLGILMVGACTLYSVSLTKAYSSELAVFNITSQKHPETSNSYVYDEKSLIPQPTDQEKTGTEYARYEYESISFVSYSSDWDIAKLKNLAKELFKNVHGDEIYAVARVELHDEGTDEYAGLHRNSYEKHSLPISINQLLPHDMSLDFSALSSVILLSGANINTTVESMSRTLSHEYGHHFAQYYFGFDGTRGDMLSKYASLRKEFGAPIYSEITDWDFYMENHMWDLQEIAAEDYVFFMGSPKSKKIVDYQDNLELASAYAISEEKYQSYVSLPIRAYNSYPHENPSLDAPSQVDDLAEYFYSFVDADAPKYNQVSSIDTMNMNLTKTTAGSYTMTWTAPWAFSNIYYTLVAYDQFDVMLKAIKTVEGDELAVAKFGNQKLISNQNEYYVDDTLDTFRFVKFRIVVVFTDGSVVFSQPYDVEF